jgi:tyrosyl-tRNA synthetase
MQGYDSVALDVDLEIGGTDQMFNMLAGRTLVRRYLNREKFVITTTLLTNPVTGEKLMSKSLSTGVGLNEPPQEMFGKVMALADAGVIQVFIDCTRLPMNHIDAIRKRLESGENPKKVKLELAHEIVKMYHDEEAAKAAEESFEKTFSKGGMPDDMLEIKLGKDETLADALVKAKIVPSKTEWRRLVDDGAVRTEKDEKITDPDWKPADAVALKIGKRRFVRIKV